MATAAAAAAVSAARSAGDTARHADDEVEEPFEPEEPEELVEPEEAEEVYEAAARQPSYASAADDDIPTVSPPIEGGDDLQSIRAIDAETEQRLKSVGVMTFDQIARWSGDDIELYGEELNLGSRIDEEQWIEQAQILAMGGDTYYSRSRSAALGGDALDAEDAGEVSPEADQAEDEAGDEVGDDAASGASAAGYGMAGAAAAAAAASQAMGRDADADESGAEAPPVEEDIEEPPAPEVEDVAPSEQAPAVPEDLSGSREGRSVAEMAAAAAAAMAAASASVTRGLRPIEPISPLSRVNPNIVLPAKLSDAIREHDSKGQGNVSSAAIGAGSVPHSRPASTGAKGDDLKRIRGIGVLIERQLNVNGITRYQQIANWSSSDIAAISAKLDFKGRIERENWVEQARILSSGGETEFSKRVDRGDVESSSGGEETS